MQAEKDSADVGALQDEKRHTRQRITHCQTSVGVTLVEAQVGAVTERNSGSPSLKWLRNTCSREICFQFSRQNTT